MGAARERSNRKRGIPPTPASNDAPVLNPAKKRGNPNPKNQFPPGVSGNPKGNPASLDGHRSHPKRLSIREQGRRLTAIPEEEWTPVPMSEGEKIARKMILAMKAAKNEVAVAQGKMLIEAFEGNKVEATGADGESLVPVTYVVVPVAAQK